jgi:prepilin-type N-terminal cleavage/methylation domain-containing protein
MKTYPLKKTSSAQGFTLVEILVTVSIIVVLMGMTFGIGKVALENAAVNKAASQIKLFESKLQEYEADTGEFPPGNGSNRSSVSLYEELYEDGIQNDGKVYMPELDPEQSDQFSKIENGLIYDPFKTHPYFYMRGVDENGEIKSGAYNPDFDLWSLGPNKEGRGEGGDSDEATDDDITNW